jgi:hypothetical protein
LLRSDLDWAYLLREAQRHRIMPLLFWQLNSCAPEAVPKGVLDELRNRFFSNSVRNLLLARELLELLDLIESNGIRTIAFKGPTLAVVAYGNLALRDFADLDVIVHREDVLKAKELLIALGYRPQHQLTRAQEEAFLHYEREHTFSHAANGTLVELHWEVTWRAFSFALNGESLWRHLERVPLGGGTVLTFSPTDTLLVLCVHGAIHLWWRLGWIYDVAWLLQTNKELDWERLEQQATAQSGRRMLHLGLFLANDLLGANIPAEVLHRTQADKGVMELAQQVRERLFSNIEEPSAFFDAQTLFHPFHLSVMERLRDRARYCIHQATTPIYDDWEQYPLPASLFPLYRALRLVRLARKYGRRASKRLR